MSKELMKYWVNKMDNFELENRCKALLKDERIEILMYQKEFYGIKNKLKKLSITPEYLEYVEKHIKNIESYVQIITVNGEDVPVKFTTKSTNIGS